MKSIELTLDDATDAAIRTDWHSLASRGLPSLATHSGASNRPHITLSAGDTLADSEELRSAVADLPLEVAFGGLILFGAAERGFVLARQVIASSALLRLHRRVHSAAPGAFDVTLPNRWTPHVTLARRISSAQLGTALSSIGEIAAASVIGARLWDGTTKTVTALL